MKAKYIYESLLEAKYHKDFSKDIQGGDCYDTAGRIILKDYDHKYTLVHGMVHGQGKLNGWKFGHAWIEKGNKVIDKSNKRNLKLNKDFYYAIGNIKTKECKYYNYTEAMEWMTKTGNFGPWEMSGDPVLIYENVAFKRGIEPKMGMNLGKETYIKKRKKNYN